MSRRLFPAGLLSALLAVLLAATVLASPADAAKLPSKKKWLADTAKVLSGSRVYVRDRAARGDAGLALNYDIDNSALASRYDKGKAIPASLRLAKHARAHGVAILFNTGRSVDQRAATIKQLKAAGYPVDALCMRNAGEKLAASKQRCRDTFKSQGYTLIANIGNRSTDFEGTGYERAYKLPNYGNKLS